MKQVSDIIPSPPSSVAEDSAKRIGLNLAANNNYLQLLEQLPDAILCLDEAWRITYANAEAVRLDRVTGIEGYPSQVFWERYPALIGSELERRYRAAMTGRVADHLEYFYEPTGVWVEINVLPINDGIAICFHHITARKVAEISRDEAVGKLKQVFESAPDSIVCIDQDWNCTFANRAARVILNTDELVGANLWTAFPLNQREPFASNYRKTMRRGVPTEFEAYYPAPLNVWFKVFARPFEDGIIIFSSDITARKRAEARRDSIHRQLEQVLDATTDCIVCLSRDWTITFMNRRAVEVLAVKGDLVGRNHWEEFPAAAESATFRMHYERAMTEGIAGEFEFYYPDPLDGWFNISVRPADGGVVLFFREITDERASRVTLLERQETLAFVQETAGVATWIIDLATRAMTFSGGSYPVFGRRCSDISSIDDWEAIIQPDHLARVREATERTLTSGQMVTVDYQVVTPDGSQLWVESRRIPVYDEGGRATHVRGVTRDITNRKQNEEKLAASQERYRVLADLNPQAIWMGDPAGNITYANQGFLEYIGFTMEQASTGLGWLEAFHKEEHPRVVEAWTRSVTTGVEYDIEARMVRASDGAVRWWWLRAQPIRDESGKIQNWLGVAMDIHDRKTSADELQKKQLETERQRSELETIYSTAPIGLALFDPVEFRYLRLNDRQAAFFGLRPDEMIGKTLTEMAPIDGLREMFEQVATGRPVINQLLEGRLATDAADVCRYWTVNYFPVYAADGSIQAISAASLEITHQKKAETALIQSEKLAAVGRLASSISHEINNPLEAITNILYLIDRDQTLPPDVKSLVNLAQSELSRVCQIATQTLRFHRQAVRATHVTAESLVSAVLNLYQGRLSNSGIRVEATYLSSTPILCFENDIRQVLNNLIANAIDAMRQHGGRLIVRAHDVTAESALVTDPEPHGVRGVRITIADTGTGMTPVVRARIFEPFFTTKDLNGTGLGLWISEGIVNRHKGRLTLRTSTHPLHHGTIFSLTLPIEDRPTQQPS